MIFSWDIERIKYYESQLPIQNGFYYYIMSKSSSKTSKGKKKIVGEYELYLEKVLGVGGFGRVIEGFDTKKKEKVAVKMIKSMN